jgi:hypothetical protein
MRPVPFERVIQALIYTMVVQALLYVVRQVLLYFGALGQPLGAWTPEVQILWSVVVAIALGVFLAWITNADPVHALLRKMRVTQQTSSASEWYGAFRKNVGYIVLHLKGDRPRRLLGWAEEWPSSSDKGHFVMARAEWLAEDNTGTPLTGVERIVIAADQVEMVEFMAVNTSAKTEGKKDGRQEGTSSATTAAVLPAGEGLSSRLTATPAPTRSATPPSPKKVSNDK